MDGYNVHGENANVAFRVAPNLPPNDITEQWRQVRGFVTAPCTTRKQSSATQRHPSLSPLPIAMHAAGVRRRNGSWV